MRNPINVLSSYQKHSSDRSYTFERVYRNLYNRELFLLAYQNIYAAPGNMTPGSDGKTIDAMSLSRIDKLIASLKDESYQPQPSRRTYIPKKNGKMRPLGIPSFGDKLVQECVRLLLEAIYEGRFSNQSHGFRPGRSCHTALFAQDSWCGRTCQEPSARRKGKISESSWRKRCGSPRRPVQCLDLRMGSGTLLGPLWETDPPWLGAPWTRNTGASPNAERASSLWRILEGRPPPKYFLSQRACRGILQRAEKRGKPLPPKLEWALKVQAGLVPPSTSTSGTK